jgi:HAD superfamily hydrolase (TIGR01459 family)
MIQKIIQNKIPVICANPDKIATHGDKTRKCAGYIADKILAKGGRVIFIGKPYPLIYEIIMEKYSCTDKSKVLMVGDTIETDVRGAKQAGIVSLLVLTGNTGNELNTHNLTLQQYLKNKCWEQWTPTYYSQNLK